MRKNILIYVIIITFFSISIYGIIHKGNDLVPNYISNVLQQKQTTVHPVAESKGIISQLFQNMKTPVGLLFLQVLTILITCRAFGYITRLIGQTNVVGEIIAGIVLGPSLLGLLFPDFSAFLFPKESLKILQFLSQIGLAFFMFTIGMELNLESIKNKAKDAVVISHASIVFPFFLGVVVSYFIYTQFATPGSNFVSFSLFMGIAMSITAFPVLARIIKEKKLTHTPLGAMALTCAAADDVTAWCVLAVVIAIAKAASVLTAVYTIALTLAYILAMLYVVKPIISSIGNKPLLNDDLDKNTVALSFLVLLFSAYFAELIGIHILFGAFLAGVIMPSNQKFKEIMANKLEDVSAIILLPIFFAITGLRTQIGLLNDFNLWILCIVIIAIAVIGKLGGSTLTARLVGQSWKDSWSIGVLMNTRGLMELVVLNIGYDMGILSDKLFAIMVLMALATTFMTSPLLDLVNYISVKKETTHKHTNGAHV
jgi:Kef-type K+ transport system membrane component KefB